MKSYDEILDELDQQSYCTVSFPLSTAYLQDVADSFLRFLEGDEKERFAAIHLDPDNRGTSVGYVIKQREFGDLDNKEYFHYNEFLEELFAEELASCGELAKEFIAKARKVYRIAKGKLEEIVGILEREHPGVQERFFPPGKKPFLYLRFLKYKSNTDRFLAKAHFDRGTCTLALAESAPGLRIGRGPESLQKVDHQEYSALFFPSATFPEEVSGNFHPAWHDVKQREGVQYSEEVTRWAIVLVADMQDTRNISFEEAHRLA